MDGLVGANGSTAPPPGGERRGFPQVKKNSALNMFEHVEHAQTCLILLSLSESISLSCSRTPLRLLPWSAPHSGSCTHSSLRQNHALHLHTQSPSRSKAAHRSVCCDCGHLQRGANEVRKHRNVAHDQLFIQDRRPWSRAQRPRGPDTYSNGAPLPCHPRFPRIPSSSSSPPKRPRTMHSCPRARSRSRGPQRRRFAALSAGRQQRSPRRPARAPLATCTW